MSVMGAPSARLRGDESTGLPSLAEGKPCLSLDDYVSPDELSLPLHESAAGLPIAMHLMAGLGDEATLLQLEGELDRYQPWNARRPRIHAALCG